MVVSVVGVGGGGVMSLEKKKEFKREKMV